MLYLTVLLNVFTSIQDDNLQNLINTQIENTFPTVYPAFEDMLINNITTESLVSNSVSGIPVDAFDIYWKKLSVDENMKNEAYISMQQLKYSKDEMVYIENITQTPAIYQHSITYFFIAGTNVNSLISLFYWYGTVISNDSPLCICDSQFGSSSLQQFCRGFCLGGAFQNWMGSKNTPKPGRLCFGCVTDDYNEKCPLCGEQDAQMIFNITTSIHVATRKKILGQ